MGWSEVNVSAWLVGVLRGVWPAKPVGMAQPARPRMRAQTPPEPEACSPETHAGGRCCNGVASFRSPLWPPAGCRRALHPAARPSADLRDPNRADRVRHRGSLRDQHIDLAQLGNNLFGGVSLLAHRDPPSACKPYFRMDHSKGGGSLSAQRAQDQRQKKMCHDLSICHFWHSDRLEPNPSKASDAAGPAPSLQASSLHSVGKALLRAWCLASRLGELG